MVKMVEGLSKHSPKRSNWRFVKNDKEIIGALVILKEDNLPPYQWQMGRIIETHPGPDGLIRAVTVKTKNSATRRAITQIRVLPTEE